MTKVKTNEQIAPNSSSQNTLGIRAKLLLSFAIIALTIGLAIVYVLNTANRSENYADQIIDTQIPIFEAIFDLGSKVNHSETRLHQYLLTKNESLKTSTQQLVQSTQLLNTQLNTQAQNVFSDQDLVQWRRLSFYINQLTNNQKQILAAPNGAQLSTLLVANQNLLNQVVTLLEGPLNAQGDRSGGFFDKQKALVHTGTDSIKQDLHTIKLTLIGLLLGVLLISFVVAIVTARKIINPLQNAIDIAKNIAAGERNNTISITTKDETGQLLSALDSMQTSIRENEERLKISEAHTKELFDNIVSTAKTFSTHSSKVAAGDLRDRLQLIQDDIMLPLGKDLNAMTDSLSQITKQITDASHNMVTSLEEVKQALDMQTSGATEQASSINEITASIEEIEKSSNQTMEKAKKLGEASERTREKGELGLHAVEQSIQGMKLVRDKVQMIAQTILDLSNQTQQVGEITSVVNSLAQQSKMLALNASIEAAKAGEAGKGFAVVATEVKNLAEQSEESTAQVQKILEDIRHATEKAVMVTEEGTKGVDQGTDLVEQTGEIVKSLSEVIHETTIASQQIEAAVRQEGVGIEQITAGMSEINQVTSSFVASAKQTLEAINNLSTIARNLKERVDTYRV